MLRIIKTGRSLELPVTTETLLEALKNAYCFLSKLKLVEIIPVSILSLQIYSYFVTTQYSVNR